MFEHMFTKISRSSNLLVPLFCLYPQKCVQFLAKANYFARIYTIVTTTLIEIIRIGPTPPKRPLVGGEGHPIYILSPRSFPSQRGTKGQLQHTPSRVGPE